jgi:hypothetical protein
MTSVGALCSSGPSNLAVTSLSINGVDGRAVTLLFPLLLVSIGPDIRVRLGADIGVRFLRSSPMCGVRVTFVLPLPRRFVSIRSSASSARVQRRIVLTSTPMAAARASCPFTVKQS